MTEDTINVVVVHFVAQLSESQKGLYYQARDNAYNDYLTRIDSQLGEVNRATIWDHTDGKAFA